MLMLSLILTVPFVWFLLLCLCKIDNCKVSCYFLFLVVAIIYARVLTIFLMQRKFLRSCRFVFFLCVFNRKGLNTM